MISKGLALLVLVATAVLAVTVRATYHSSPMSNCYDKGPGPSTPTIC